MLHTSYLSSNWLTTYVSFRYLYFKLIFHPTSPPDSPPFLTGLLSPFSLFRVYVYVLETGGENTLCQRVDALTVMNTVSLKHIWLSLPIHIFAFSRTGWRRDRERDCHLINTTWTMLRLASTSNVKTTWTMLRLASFSKHNCTFIISKRNTTGTILLLARANWTQQRWFSKLNTTRAIQQTEHKKGDSAMWIQQGRFSKLNPTRAIQQTEHKKGDSANWTLRQFYT